MDFMSRVINLEEDIQNSEVVITGEGSIDQQTLEGKVVFKIHELCKKYNKPLLIVSGINKLRGEEMKAWKQKYSNFEIYDLVSSFGIEKSLSQTEDCLGQLAELTLVHKIKEFVN